MNHMLSSLEKGSIKLVEYSDSTFNYDDKFFIQNGCVGFFLTKNELKDLHAVIGYYLNIDDISEIKLMVDGEYVAIQ